MQRIVQKLYEIGDFNDGFSVKRKKKKKLILRFFEVLLAFSRKNQVILDFLTHHG